MEKTSSRAEGTRTHHLSVKARALSFLVNCSALRGKGKPRSLTPIGIPPVESPRRGSSNHHEFRASHNRRPLSTALPRKGLPPWFWLFAGVSVSTPAVAKFFSSVFTATAGRFAVARCVGITTGELNAMRPTAITNESSKANWPIASVKKTTGNVSAWL